MDGPSSSDQLTDLEENTFTFYSRSVNLPFYITLLVLLHIISGQVRDRQFVSKLISQWNSGNIWCQSYFVANINCPRREVTSGGYSNSDTKIIRSALVLFSHVSCVSPLCMTSSESSKDGSETAHMTMGAPDKKTTNLKTTSIAIQTCNQSAISIGTINQVVDENWRNQKVLKNPWQWIYHQMETN